MAPIELQGLPVPIPDLVDYIADNPDKPMVEILEPYRKYEAQLRSIFAQDRSDPRLSDPHVNVLPLFTDKTKHITTRARNLDAESQEEKDRYIMVLPDDKRRPHGSPATVASLKEFRKNFGIFSENSLADLDWSNVVAAGSSVVNCLLPVPDEFNTTKRKLREYYHEKFCPASDVDLFLYGLTEEEAIEKIKQIEKAIRDAILTEVTVVRTKYAITIASQYPTRHVQIVLRSYKSIGEILTGFDIDAAGGAYDGSQVYVAPRALGSFITQINHIDLSRRSPSYENRLSKYSHRNFEVYWKDLDRSRIDPTIFERSFMRTLGLARLLVLERLPTSTARETYLNKRRAERGRPTVYFQRIRMGGNIKDNHEDEIADWVDETEVSNYHTFTVPYGQHFHAKKIEKLCYTRDLLLNAEWNQPKEREIYLHRHPAFFGRVKDIIEDCCGSCPVPVTPEEIEQAEKEANIYISGKVKLLVDDPGRQQIGSFNPLTDDDWTDMAYVGNTARLCQSIVDSNVDEVLDWLSQPDADPNQRDYTGRTPLQLAVMSSTPDVVKALIDHGARLTARMADGKTALHLAAERGIPEMIKYIMEKSIANEEKEEEKEDTKRKLQRETSGNIRPKKKHAMADSDEESIEDEDDEGEDSDMEMVDEEDSDDGAHSFATGSFVNVKKDESDDEIKQLEEPDEDEPDFYKIDVLAWDMPCSPLHLAIASGHEEVVKTLCDYGGDALLPMKFLNSDKEPVAALLTLTLALALPIEKAKSMAILLLSLGATSSQADLNGATAFHRYVESGNKEMMDVLWEHDKIGVNSAINHLVFSSSYWSTASTSPLHTAIVKGDPILVLKLLNAGAKPNLDFDTWLKATKFSKASRSLGNYETNKSLFDKNTKQPLITALESCADVSVPIYLLEQGADPNAMTSASYGILTDEWSRRYNKGETALDLVRRHIKQLQEHKVSDQSPKKPTLIQGMDEHLATFMEGSYQHWLVSRDIKSRKESFENSMKEFEKAMCKTQLSKKRDMTFEVEAVRDAIAELKRLEEIILSKGAKTFAELHPEIVDANPTIYATVKPVETKADLAKEKPYEYNFHFTNVTDVTESRKAAYIQLFEAAWAGDLEKIKSLTLQSWDEEHSEPPLKISVNDSFSNSPFSLAFMLKHYDVAWGIAEIALAQWAPPDDEKRAYKLDMGGVDDGSDEDEDEDAYSDDANDRNHEPRIVSRVVDQKFTIENIGQVSMQVKSNVTPLSMMSWSAWTFTLTKDGKPDPESYRVQTIWDFLMDKGEEDETAFKKFLDMCVHFGRNKCEASEESEPTGYTLPEDVFRNLVENGNVRLLTEVIRRTGAGIPLDHLVKKTGVEVKVKPRFYQGLTVYGKKRKDWATAGRNMYVKSTGLRSPPLLHAVSHCQLEAVEWFLSEAPLRLYVEFSRSRAAQEDTRFKHLIDSPGGFENAVSRWLGNQNDLVLHCAISNIERDQGIRLIKYLIKACPSALEARNSKHGTPLMTAALYGRLEYVKILIEAGADQSARDENGHNIIHCALGQSPRGERLKAFLDILDPDLRAHLMEQRTNLEDGGYTPLHFLVNKVQSGLNPSYHWNTPTLPGDHTTESAAKLMGVLLDYGSGVELEMLDSAGNSCLHTAVLSSCPWMTRVLLERRPKSLYRENAVGLTPLEVARHKIMAKSLSQPNPINIDRNRNSTFLDKVKTVAQRKQDKEEEEKKKKKSSEKEGMEPNSDKVWQLCSMILKRYPDKRKLVSLGDASDVAKRLGEQHTRSRYFSSSVKRDEYDEPEEDEGDGDSRHTDFVDTLWGRLNSTAWWRPGDGGKGSKDVPCKVCGHGHPEEKVESEGESGGSESESEDEDEEMGED